jgi:ribosome modulation factor
MAMAAAPTGLPAPGETRGASAISSPATHADVAELVDAHGSGPCLGNQVEVRVLSSASRGALQMAPRYAFLAPERQCFTVRPACCQRTYKPVEAAARQRRDRHDRAGSQGLTAGRWPQVHKYAPYEYFRSCSAQGEEASPPLAPGRLTGALERRPCAPVGRRHGQRNVAQSLAVAEIGQPAGECPQ